MKSYRIYFIGPRGRLQLGQGFTAAGDGEAVREALGLGVAGKAAELWEGGRLVGRFAESGVFTPA